MHICNFGNLLQFQPCKDDWENEFTTVEAHSNRPEIYEQWTMHNGHDRFMSNNLQSKRVQRTAGTK